ncbi:acetylglutamate kinase [Thermincola ferriacetica]|uniref:Acetylglutamate kinase n=1 Tax=Thermincola ferriacetica TaxID=281456 RepID=A0A0L6W1I8_9FIRM|nr:acetylglutamate kinase [Thermincola ferriacetica]KNZ69427.1 acetylglutamate kinase [Thermincola ferriacetica]
MNNAVEKANVLIEALPYIRKFYGKTVVIKYGGHAMINDELKQAVIKDVILMKLIGINPVIVHGGGPKITDMLKRLNIPSQFVGGCRVTDPATMEIVEMVLVGKINKEIVALINRHGGKAVGLSGKDANLIQAVRKMGKSIDNEGKELLQDIGFVGDVEKINPEIIQTVINEGYIPVVAPVGVGAEGESYNINADYVAGEIAIALKADKLILLTDVEGIFEDYNNKDTLISELKLNQVNEKITSGVISGGMIPKVECCVRAVEGGVTTTHILDGRIPHSILLEIFTDRGIGTMVVR